MSENILYIYNKNYIDSVNILKEFREKQNYKVILYEYKNSNSYNSLKTYINNIYNNNSIKYILLFGSVEEIPTYMRNLNGWEYFTTKYNKNITTAASDISYGIINNSYKIIIGRLSPGDNLLNKNELTLKKKKQNIKNQINKIISYENYIDLIISNNFKTDDNWVKNIIGIASNEGDGFGLDGLSDNKYMRRELTKYENKLNCNFVELYDSRFNSGHIGDPSNKNSNNTYDKTGNPNTNDLDKHLDNGASIMLYTGHSSEVSIATTSYSVNNTKNLSNKNKYFLGCVVGCSIGSHDEDYMCLAESFQVAKDKGSIGMFVSSILQSWQPPMHMQREFNSTIINSNKIMTLGEIFKQSVINKKFLPRQLGGDSNKIDFWHYHILGDPVTRFILTLPNLSIDKSNNKSIKINIKIIFTGKQLKIFNKSKKKINIFKDTLNDYLISRSIEVNKNNIKVLYLKIKPIYVSFLIKNINLTTLNKLKLNMSSIFKNQFKLLLIKHINIYEKKSYKNLNKFNLYSNIYLDETKLEFYDFSVDKNSNLYVINKQISNQTELIVMRNDYKTMLFKKNLPISSNKLWINFLILNNKNILGIRKNNLRNKIDLHLIGNNYSEIIGNYKTPLQSKFNWHFVLSKSEDLYCIKRKQKKVLIFILSKKHNYKRVVFRKKTKLRYDNNTIYDFCIDSSNNLVCVKKGDRSKSNKTEIYILTRKSNYNNFLFKTKLKIPISNHNWSFFVNKNDNNLVSILKGPKSGSNKIEVHTFNRKSKYKTLSKSSSTSLNLI